MLKLTMDSPLAAELNALVLEKLNEYGWTDNEVLANFIVVMIANGKSKDEITTELAEILPEHSVDFASWLFDRMDAIANQNTAPLQIQAHLQPPQQLQPAVQQPALAHEPQVDQISFDDVQDSISLEEEKHEARVQREARPSRLLQSAISSVSREDPASLRPTPARKYDNYSSRHETRRDREMRDRSMSPARPGSRVDGSLTTRGLREDREERIRFRRTSEERRQDQQRNINDRLGTPRNGGGRRGGRSIDERLGSRHDSDDDHRRGGGRQGGRNQTQGQADRDALRSIESRLGRRRNQGGQGSGDYFDGEDLPKHPKSWSKDPERMLLTEAELTRQSIADHTAKHVRCKFWPNCQSGDQCRFWHPKELCQAYPNCPNAADTCLFIHPLADPTPEQLAGARRIRANQQQQDGSEENAINGEETGLRALRALGASSFNGVSGGRAEDCKFGLACTRPGCLFRHPGRVSEPNQQQCRFYPNCTKPNCPFLHPSYGEALAVKDSSMEDVNAASKPAITRLPIPCRFGNNCTRPDCHFTHPRDGPSATELEGAASGTATAPAAANGTTPQVLMPICKFNAGCTRPDCKFRHTVIRPLLQQQQKVSTAERFGQGLIVDDSEVEKMPVPASAHWATGGVSHQPQHPQQQEILPPQLQQEQLVAPPPGVAVDASMEMDMDL